MLKVTSDNFSNVVLGVQGLVIMQKSQMANFSLYTTMHISELYTLHLFDVVFYVSFVYVDTLVRKGFR